MSVVFRPLTLGEEMYLTVYTSPLTDLSAVPITVILDSPDGSRRITLRHLNGGTDGTLIDSDRKVQFYKTSAWTAANLSAGQWTVRVLKGSDSTTQNEIGYGTKLVLRPPSGALPTSH